MLRYLRALRLYWSTSIAASMEYRLNFAFALISSLGQLGGGVFGVWLFYRGDYQFAGWSFAESMIVLGGFTLLSGFARGILTPNLNRIVLAIEDGTLDFVLLQPIDSQFQVSLRRVDVWALPDVALGLGLIAWAGAQVGLAPLHLLVALVPLLCGMVSLYSLWFALASTSIWFVKVYNATEVLRGLLEAGRYPMSAYPVAWRFFFTFIVPVAFLTTVPARAILGREELVFFAGSAALALALLLATRAFWRFGLRSYTSASS
jgi:ABC-2 type transport system permease protein